MGYQFLYKYTDIYVSSPRRVLNLKQTNKKQLTVVVNTLKVLKTLCFIKIIKHYNYNKPIIKKGYPNKLKTMEQLEAFPQS